MELNIITLIFAAGLARTITELVNRFFFSCVQRGDYSNLRDSVCGRVLPKRAAYALARQG